MSRINGITQRMTYDKALMMVRAAGYEPQNAMLTQNTIRGEALMSTSTSQIKIPLLVNDPGNNNGGSFATEYRLKQTDVLVVSELAILCAVPANAADGAYDVFTYGNPLVFTTSTSAAAVRGAYKNGYLNLLINNQQVVPHMDMRRFYKAQYTQQQANMYYTTSAIAVQDSMDGSEDGTYPIQPNLVLAGNDNLDLYINTIVGASAITANSRWIAEIRGFLAQNCSKIASSTPTS